MNDFEKELENTTEVILELDISYSDIAHEMIEASRSGVYLGELELTDLSELGEDLVDTPLPIEPYAIPGTSHVRTEATPKDIMDALKKLERNNDDV